ncbi:MAG TPA: DMT family transporter [Tissierellia bacterium]|nr:DMT family transporter [Tissierellia bacterium]
MDKKKLFANGQLMLASAIWGLAFVAQRVGMGSVGPFMFGAARYMLGALTLYLLIRVMRLRGQDIPITKGAIKGGLTCGVFLLLGSTLQQSGLVYTTASKAGFITALYIVLVPVLAGVIFRKKIRLRVWVGVALATLGLYLVSFSGTLEDINIGDVMMFIGAFLWAGHIFAIDHFVKKYEPLVLSMVQFTFASIASAVLTLMFETVELQGVLEVAVPILYTGIFSAGIGFTLQMMGQRHTDPTITSMILSLEAVFGAVGGYLLLNEIMTARELTGFALIFIAIILAQLPAKQKELQ